MKLVVFVCRFVLKKIRLARYTCPNCSKSICDMSDVWEKLDKEVASVPMPMPDIYQNNMESAEIKAMNPSRLNWNKKEVLYDDIVSLQVWILCKDCGANSEVHFHIVAHKCPGCNSYNTRLIKGAPMSSCSSTPA
ncbi:hypothetical protein Droror1_Dr00025814 [Drosera rotundifolia]